jgi:hypothetical protein
MGPTIAKTAIKKTGNLACFENLFLVRFFLAKGFGWAQIVASNKKSHHR